MNTWPTLRFSTLPNLQITVTATNQSFKMSRTFDYAPAGSYAFDWNAQPELNDPVYESPVPCRAGYNCCYEGVCSFVHPGEEGLGRRIFPARQAGEKDVVRIFGQPHKKATFYERRRLRLSWPEWCRRSNMPVPVAQPKVEAATLGSAPKYVKGRKQVIDLSAPVAVEAPQSAAAQPQPQQPAFDQAAYQAAYQQWYAAEMVKAQEYAKAQEKAQEKAFMEAAYHHAQTQQVFGAENWATYERILYANGAFTSMSIRQSYGELLFGKVAQLLESHFDIFREEGWLTEKTTAGKVVGMFLDAYSDEELAEVYASYAELKEAVADACVTLLDAKPVPVPALEPVAEVKPAPLYMPAPVEEIKVSAKSVLKPLPKLPFTLLEGAWGDIVDDF